MLKVFQISEIKYLANLRQMENISALIAKYKQFIIYSIIGASGATLDLIIFFILFNYFGIDKNISTIISTSAGIINNFILNVFLNFKVKDNLIKRFATFYFVGVTGIILTILILLIFVDIFKFNANIVKVLSIIIVVLVQYTLNKKLSFKKQPHQD